MNSSFSRWLVPAACRPAAGGRRPLRRRSGSAAASGSGCDCDPRARPPRSGSARRAARLRAGGQHPGTQPQLLVDPGTLVASSSGPTAMSPSDVPLVEHERSRAAALHRHLGDPEVLGGDAVRGVANHERDVGALGGPLRAQRGVVLERLADLRLSPQPAVSTSTSSPILEPHRQVDRVASGAGELRDDHPVDAEEAVDER